MSMVPTGWRTAALARSAACRARSTSISCAISALTTRLLRRCAPRNDILELCIDALKFFGFLDSFIDRADHVERLFGKRVMIAFDQFFEAADRVRARHIAAGLPGEGFRHEKG